MVPRPLPVQLDLLLPGPVSSCELKAKSWEVASQFHSHVTLSNYGNYRLGWGQMASICDSLGSAHLLCC